MSIQTVKDRFCVQTAVYWACTGNTGTGLTFAAPVEILVRWSSKIEVMIDSTGKEFTSKAKVLLKNDLLTDESYLYLGTLAELDSDPNPLEVNKAFKVRLQTKTFMPRSTTDYLCVAYF